MITVKTFNIKGEETEKSKLSEKLFGVKASERLLAQAVRVYLSNQRAGSAKTKTRGEVFLTTAKMYKQKGTGRARHGSYSAPIFVGGGIAHGPTGTQNYKKNMPMKMGIKALAGALTNKVLDKKLFVLVGVEKSSGKTKEAREIIGKMAIGNESVMLVVENSEKNVARSWRNLNKSTVLTCENINSYKVISCKNIVLTKAAVANLEKKYAN